MNLSDDFDWTPEEVAKYQIVYPTIPQARWDRARDVDCRDLILELTGASNRGNKISCPFHGRDRRPSFQLYPNTNSCWCFGCDPKESPTDPISFVAKFYEINKLEAMKWIENHYSCLLYTSPSPRD